MDVFNTDTLYNYIGDKIEKKQNQINLDERRYPTIYITNQNQTEYLEVWGSTDIEFRQFYAIGYTEDKKCSYCGTNIGQSNFKSFYTNKNIRLGDDIKNVWPKVNLNFYRRFKFKGVEYFYFEKGVKNEVPFTPNEMFYYKFKNNKLIEIGFGNGFEGTNPMFQDLTLKG